MRDDGSCSATTWRPKSEKGWARHDSDLPNLTRKRENVVEKWNKILKEI